MIDPDMITAINGYPIDVQWAWDYHCHEYHETPDHLTDDQLIMSAAIGRLYQRAVGMTWDLLSEAEDTETAAQQMIDVLMYVHGWRETPLGTESPDADQIAQHRAMIWNIDDILKAIPKKQPSARNASAGSASPPPTTEPHEQPALL